MANASILNIGLDNSLDSLLAGGVNAEDSKVDMVALWSANKAKLSSLNEEEITALYNKAVVIKDKLRNAIGDKKGGLYKFKINEFLIFAGENAPVNQLTLRRFYALIAFHCYQKKMTTRSPLTIKLGITDETDRFSDFLRMTGNGYHFIGLLIVKDISNAGLNISDRGRRFTEEDYGHFLAAGLAQDYVVYCNKELKESREPSDLKRFVVNANDSLSYQTFSSCLVSIGKDISNLEGNLTGQSFGNFKASLKSITYDKESGKLARLTNVKNVVKTKIDTWLS